MDLEEAIRRANSKQAKAIQHLAGPLDLSAGAGTGKTHTLTWRLIDALISEDPDTPGDINEVLVITFTEKAAGELVSRVRAALKDVGRQDDALDIDDAWISTIHAMCARMLKEHAFEAEIDPFFTAILGDEERLLKQQAYEDALAWARGDGRFLPLLDDYAPDKLFRTIGGIRAKLAVVPAAADHLCLGPKGTSFDMVLKDFQMAIARCAQQYEGLARTDDTAAAAYAAMEATLTGLRELGVRYASSSAQEGHTDTSHLSELVENLLELIGQMPKTPMKKKAIKPIAQEERDAKAQAVEALGYAYSSQIGSLVVEFAFRYQEIYRDLKDERNVLDMDDLLVCTYELLTKNPTVAAEYGHRFKLVMIDECQDTDQLQVDILSAICGHDLSTLCIVGDEQQSIYRFRGADVAVYRRLKNRIAGLATEKEPLSLNINYRSHPDILAAVNSLFCQESVFGDRCLSLEPAPSGQSKAGRDLGDEPRVRICYCEDGHGGTNEKRWFQAEYIAATFERLLGQHPELSPGDCAILLGAMINVDVYTAALERHGLASITSGGSGFYTLCETSTLIDYLALLDNPHDENAFIRVMTSPLYDLFDDDLLELKDLKSVIAQEEREEGRGIRKFRKTSLFDALQRAKGGRSEQARRKLSIALDEARAGEISRALEETFTGSSWEAYLLTRATHTRATIANMVRFCDLVKDAEAMPGASVASIAAQFARARENQQDEPAGVLVSQAAEAVRVLTVHKSKGLEFPVVAVAELFDEDGFRDRDEFYSEQIEDTLHIAFKPGAEWLSKVGGDEVKKIVADGRKTAGETDDLASALIEESCPRDHTISLREHEKCAAREEHQRLFYVACTRAVELLVLCPACKDHRLTTEQLSSRPALAGIARAFFKGGELPGTRRERFRLGSGADAGYGLYEHYAFAKDWQSLYGPVLEPAETLDWADADTDGEPDKESRAFDNRRLFPPVVLHVERSPRRRYSYSSLAFQAAHHRDYEEVEPAETELDETSRIPAETQDRQPVMTANDLGSAFHLAAQLMADTQDLTGLTAERLDTLCRRFGIDDTGRQRLIKGIDRWRKSDLAQRAFAYPQVLAEMPFDVEITLPGNDSFQLDGSIDLYCRDPRSGEVLIVDYKTGLSDGRAEEGGLAGRYEFQARCYAYAARRAGAREVEVVFIRPEVEAGNEPQEIRPALPHELSELEREIGDTYLRAREAETKASEA